MADINDSAKLAEKTGCHFIRTDVTKEADVEALMKETQSLFGNLDIMVNNAGIILPEQLLTDAVIEDFKRLYEVNVFGVVNGLKYAPRYMNDGGVILNTASNSANGDYAGYGAYISSKCAVVGLTKAAAIELAVMSITTPLGRMCKAEEAAALYHFLASDDCRYITGEDIYIDGGLKAGPSIQMIEHLLKGLS